MPITDLHGSTNPRSANAHAPAPVIIQPRSFNHLVFHHDTVTKMSSSPALAGELYFYQNVPSDISYFFPALVRYTNTPATLTITRVPAVTLSTLLTTSALKPSHICAVLQSLHAMHTWKPCEHSSLLYLNHATKVQSRLNRSLDLYEKLGLSSNGHFAPLLGHLHEYERSKSGVPAAVIHGDPVLTNILLLASVQGDEEDDQVKKEQLKFIDMRGAQGSHLTLAGDAVYDLAKVFQSLLGYDFILADVPLNTCVVNSLADLLNMFWKLVGQLYPSVQPRHVVTVCAGLVTSLIPLHDNHRHRMRFAVIATVLLQLLQNNKKEFVGNMKSATELPTEINDYKATESLLHSIAHQVNECV